MLLSVLIPSLRRFDKLKTAVKSWMDCSPKGSFEIIVRLHASDKESLGRLDELYAIFPVQVTTGRDKKEGESNGFLWSEILSYSQGKYCQFWSDDLTIAGDWETPLKAAPNSGVLIQPEWHALNDSVYSRQDDGPTPFVSMGVIRDFGLLHIEPVPDLYYYRELVEKRKWKPYFLNNVAVHHTRCVDSTLPEHEY